MKGKDTTQFHLTLPAELHAKIKARAQSHGRSINMEIVRTLDDSFYKMPLSRTDQDGDERLAAEIAEQVREIAVGVIRKNKK